MKTRFLQQLLLARQSGKRHSQSTIGKIEANQVFRETNHESWFAALNKKAAKTRIAGEASIRRLEHAIDVRDFIVRKSRRMTAMKSFSAGPSKRTKAVWEKLQPYFRRSERRACLPSTRKPLDAAGAQGRLHRPRQRSDRRPADRCAVQAGDLPVRRPAHGRGGSEGGRLRGRSAGAQAFTKYRKTHNDGVFDAYTPEIMRCRKSASSPVCPTPMAAAASSATTGASHSTASTACSRPSGQSAHRSTTCGRPRRSSACARSWPNRCGR